MICFILTIIAEILGTLSGFGSSFFFVSLAQFFLRHQNGAGVDWSVACVQQPVQALSLEKNFFAGTSAMIDMGVNVTRTIMYLDMDYLDNRLLCNIPFMHIAPSWNPIL